MLEEAGQRECNIQIDNILRLKDFTCVFAHMIGTECAMNVFMHNNKNNNNPTVMDSAANVALSVKIFIAG